MTEAPRPSRSRWFATVTYRSDNGPIDVNHGFEELYELHDLVERGPDWNAIERIEIRLVRVKYPNDTIEKAAER